MEKENQEVNDVTMRRIVSNADNELLMPHIGSGLIFGHVDEVNGAGGKEVPEFISTRHELIQLLKYWYRTAIDIEFEWFVLGQFGSCDRRLNLFAHNRAGRIHELLGHDEADEIIHETFDEFGKEQNERIWNIYVNGTAEEREELQNELYGDYTETFYALNPDYPHNE